MFQNGRAVAAHFAGIESATQGICSSYPEAPFRYNHLTRLAIRLPSLS